ncbi:DNA glycosylase [Hypoxylon trugodes]|uniref:DNA glycosylase n=1 Tax=Hypoxylon trugodes TaxID=326681 RepID=UPI00219B06F5|nr:DNA glycosylase [Hypoxylon trugodes]KAI1382752.1 DNA glycosylase [Hypoxylon trugodes]
MRRSSRITRPSVSTSENGGVKKKSLYFSENEEIIPAKLRRTGVKKRPAKAQSDASDGDVEEYIESDVAEEKQPAKKRKVAARTSKKNENANAQLYARIFGEADTGANGSSSVTTPKLPARIHGLNYHRPLLLDSRDGRGALLTWFDSVSTLRNMPWRKSWIDPDTVSDETVLRKMLEQRAYEVWISEVMLQQTRVAAVVDYWTRWMDRWPTIHDLAAAQPDEVLSAWRGLGYYSRATRIHEAAKKVCGDPDMKGLLPRDVGVLVKNVPGVGRYTAGAITAIVFGEAKPMVDGNVLRVLSRQMGVLGDVKTDKGVIDLLWEVAGRLAEAIAGDSDKGKGNGAKEEEKWGPSDRPGRWGQALMELGSTVCIPKPNCATCPITSSCRAYGEGLQLAMKKGLVPKSTTTSTITNGATADIEDACTICKPFEEYADEDGSDIENQVNMAETTKSKTKSRIQTTLQSFAFTQKTSKSEKSASSKPLQPSTPALSNAAIEVITNHARKFPVRAVKKAVREEETLVCAIRRYDGRYLLHRRPEKGLLAGLWELPSYILEDPQNSTLKTRKKDAEKYVVGVIDKARSKGVKQLKHVGEIGCVPWLFSHLKLTMHVHLFELGGGMNDNEVGVDEGMKSRWADIDAIDAESMGTGMRKCWAVVKEATGG